MLVDHLKTVNKVNKVNSELRKYFLFCNLYKSCLYNNSPDPTLFAPKDGLHLLISYFLFSTANPPSKMHKDNGKKTEIRI
jgi:hypothetical protein